MSDLARKLFGDDVPAKQLAVIVDLDETLCTGFDCPVPAGVDLLTRVDRARLVVHYVTARTTVSREGTEKFIEDHRLPGWRNLHYCPKWQGSPEHKKQVHLRLAKEFHVLASIGDYEGEEGVAARAAGIPFILVNPARPNEGWEKLASLLAAASVLLTK
jgi:hypothetical protein